MAGCLLGIGVLFVPAARFFIGFDQIGLEGLLTSFLLGAAILFWFGHPWTPRCSAEPINWIVITPGGVLSALGTGTGLGAIVALGWALMAGAVIQSFFRSSLGSSRLVLLLWLAFPWVLTDMNAVGWWFRLSAAGVSETVFGLCGFDVARNGTFLQVEGMNVSVEEACSGLKQLHLLLFTGVALAVRNQLTGFSFGLTLLLLPAIAWLANTIRVVFITGVGAAFGVEFASGSFHQAGGLMVVASMFLLTWLFIRQLQPREAAVSN